MTGTTALPGELLVSRLHVDLLRVSTACCRTR
ncbi:putative leader peptide [Modestobacter sp. NPDC049651]